MEFAGGDKSGGKIHKEMWIMWKSPESNRFFVQCVRLTIILPCFAAVCCGKREAIITRMLIFYEFIELKSS